MDEPAGDERDLVDELVQAVASADRLAHRVAAWRDLLVGEVFRRGAVVRRAETPPPLSDPVAWEWARRGMLAELALALRVPESTLASRLHTTAALTSSFPLLAEAHAVGDVSRWHVDVMLELFDRYPADVRAAADEALTPRARVLDPSRFRAVARRWRARHAGPVTAEARRQAVADRHVAVSPADDHMAWLSALLPAEQAYAAFHRLSDLAAAVQGPDEDRTLPQLRADAMAALLIDPDACDAAREVLGPAVATTDALAGADGEEVRPRPAAGVPLDGADRDPRADEREGVRPLPAVGAPRQGSGLTAKDLAQDLAHNPTWDGARAAASAPAGAFGAAPPRFTGPVPGGLRGIRATVVLTVPVLSLLGRSDEPAVLEGHGPIDIETARELAAGAPSFIRVLTDPHTGAVLSVGRRRYQVPADLRTALEVRDVTCRFPGCSRRAARCDLDHSTAWAAGGATAADNLAHLCRRHHRLKHTARWRLRQEPGGVLVWLTPSGREYRDEPAVHLDTGSGDGQRVLTTAARSEQSIGAAPRPATSRPGEAALLGITSQVNRGSVVARRRTGSRRPDGGVGRNRTTADVYPEVPPF